MNEAGLPFSPAEVFASLPPGVEWAGLRYVREQTSYRVLRNERPDRNLTAIDEGVMLVQTETQNCSSNGSEARQSFDMVHLGLSATAAEGAEFQTRFLFPNGAMVRQKTRAHVRSRCCQARSMRLPA